MALKKISAKAAPKYLPILRHSERALSELRTRPSTSLNHIAKVVERDPCLAFELFAQVNRDLKRAGRPPANNIRRAILVFGISRYLDHTKSCQTIESNVQAKFLRASMNHLGRSCTAARIAESLANERGGVNPEEAFAVAFARDFDKYASFVVEATSVAIDWRNARTLLPGLALPQVSGDPLNWCVDLAVSLAGSCQFAWDPVALSPYLDQITKQLGHELKHTERVLRETILAVAHETKHFNEFPPARFLLQPGPAEPHAALLFEPDEPASEEIEEPKAKTARKRMLDRLKLKRDERGPDTQQSGADCRGTSEAYIISNNNFAQISRALDKASLDLETLGQHKSSRPRVLPYALQIMNKVLKVEQVLFIAHPGEQRLVARLVLTGGKTPKLIKRELKLEDNPVLRKMLSGAPARHLSTAKLALHEQLFDEQTRNFIGENAVYVIPLSGKRKLIGIILAAVPSNTTDDWSQHFRLNCELCEQLVGVLDRASV